MKVFPLERFAVYSTCDIMTSTHCNIIHTDSMEWAIYVMTFIDVMKQNGVGSGGTLHRECMGSVVFHHEKLDMILKITG